MSGHWLQFGMIVVAMGIVALAIARLRKRVGSKWDQTLSTIAAIAMLGFAIASAWLGYERQAARAGIDGRVAEMQSRTASLKQRIDDNAAGLAAARDSQAPSAAQRLEQEQRLAGLKKETRALAAEREALAKEAASIRQAFDAEARRNASQDFLLFLWAIGAVAVLSPLAYGIAAARERKGQARRSA